MTALGGAVPGGPVRLEGFDRPLGVDVRFDLSGGWIHEGGGGSISAVLEASGGVYFRNCGSRQESLGINYSLTDPQIVIEDGEGRLVFKVGGLDSTPFPGTRTVVVEFEPGNPSEEGGELVWSARPGVVAPGAYDLFLGQYRPDSEFGDDFGSATFRVIRPQADAGS